MASESSEERAVSVTLPVELTDWLAEKAAELEVPEDELVVQLLASYKTAEELDGDPGELLDDDLETAVRDVIAERIPDIARAVEDSLDAQGSDESLEAVEDHVESEVDRLEQEITGLESTFQGKLEDVRERVIQIKKETGSKAPAEHDHPELDAVEGLGERLTQLESAVEDLAETVDGRSEEVDELAADVEEISDVESRLNDVEEKVNTVAWIVSDLREAHEAERGERRAVEQLKRRAAEEDIDRAICDDCDEAVDVALLTEPTCPHCQSTVNDVRLPSGFFGKPHLEVARQLEAGDAADDGRSDSNVPDAAQR
jgi:DNA repair exonuclease SbcCD ATPase subunit